MKFEFESFQKLGGENVLRDTEMLLLLFFVPSFVAFFYCCRVHLFEMV